MTDNALISVVLNIFVISLGLGIIKLYMGRIMNTVLKIQMEIEIVKVKLTNMDTYITKLKEIEIQCQSYNSRLARLETIIENLSKEN